MKTILDSNGRILYRVLPCGSVTNKTGHLIGRIRNGTTYNRDGKIVARAEAPGLLLTS